MRRDNKRKQVRLVNVMELRAPVITVISEGRNAELIYLKHIKELYGYTYNLKPRFSGVISFRDMDSMIREVVSANGFAVCIFDLDVSIRNEAENRKCEKLKRKYGKYHNVLFCDSLPSIEYWFLLHYRETNRAFNSTKELRNDLKKYIPDYDKDEKFLNNIEWVKDMCAEGKFEDALQRARNINSDESPSHTNVFKLFDKLNENKNL